MGFSKKKSKNRVKAAAHVGQKAKDKVRKRLQIQHGQKLKESKKKAAALTGQASGRVRRKGEDDAVEGLDAVDALFADVADDGSENEGARGSDAPSDSEESSAGAFHDVDGDDDGLPQEDIEGLDDSNAGARHEQELKAIKEKDPEFYKFLVENDQALLNFRAPDPEPGAEVEVDEEEAVEGKTDKKQQQQEQQQAAQDAGRVLTMERFKRLQETADTSFTAFKAAMNCFHLAVRSIEEKQPGAETLEGDDDDGKKKKKKSPKKTLMRIEDEATFSEVLEWSVTNMIGLLEKHAGELAVKVNESKPTLSKKQRHKRQRGDEEPTEPGAGLVDVTLYSRWKRVKVVGQIFWEETFFLLSHLVDPQMLEFVLRTASTPAALTWLWPFKALRQRFFKKCCSSWSTASAHKVRLLSFLFIRNSAAMALHMPGKQEKDVPQLEAMIKSLLRSFVDVATMGYSWRSFSTFRFMENCLVELLRIDDATAYRVGYACIRQLALILRNACIASSQSTEKSKKKKNAQMKAMALVGWPFIRAIYLWTKAVGTVAVLRPLAYPLSMIIMGATKTRLASLQNYPFVSHCLRCLNRLGSSLELFVPVSSHLLKTLSVCLQSMEKAHRKRGAGGSQGLSGSKAPDLEVLLRFSESQLLEILPLEAVGASICILLTDHLGLLSRSPAFPEIVAPVLLHLKKFGKHCRSEPLRRQLKALQAAAETTISDVCAQRETLTEVPSWKKFLMFDATTPMSKARDDMLKRKTSDEKSRVEAAMREEALPAVKRNVQLPVDDDNTPVEKSKKALKRERQKERKLKEGTLGKKSEKYIPLGKSKTDTVEEMEFSSGEE